MSVPCNGCRLCCQRDVIVLFPEQGDKLYEYEFEMAGEHAVLKRQANGSCIYLGPEGCTNYENRPVICRSFDCADMVMRMRKRDIPLMLREGLVSKSIIRRGKELLRRGYRPKKETPKDE